MSASLRRVGVVVRGRVQGVGFRASTRYQAERLGVHGWVANRPDGAVALEAEGANEAIEALIAWCRQGPSLAAVSTVEIAELVVNGETGFAIRR